MAERARDPWARWVLRPENELESMGPVRDRVSRHMRPLVEHGDGESRMALAYFRAVRER